MFLEPDEHIIIMEEHINLLGADDLKRLEDAGVKTVYPSASIYWEKIYNPLASSSDWSSLDSRLENLLNSNLKIILPFYYTMPNWFPDEWYLKKDPILTNILPNYGNEEFGQAVDTFASEILEHYSDYRDRIQLTFAIPAGGEFFWDAMLTDNFPVSDGVLINFVLNRQKFLFQQHGEVWLYVHNFLGHPMNWNNGHLQFMYHAIREEFPDAPFYSMQFAHLTCGNVPTDEYRQRKITEYWERFGIKFYIGSDYCEGLTRNFDVAMKQKAWGFFTCPIDSENKIKHTSVEPWMVDTIRETNRRIKEVWDGRN